MIGPSPLTGDTGGGDTSQIEADLTALQTQVVGKQDALSQGGVFGGSHASQRGRPLSRGDAALTLHPIPPGARDRRT